MDMSRRRAICIWRNFALFLVFVAVVYILFDIAMTSEWLASYSWQGEQALHVPSHSALTSRRKLHRIMHKVVFRGHDLPNSIHDVNLYVLGLADIYYVVTMSISDSVEFENAVRIISGSPLGELSESPDPSDLYFASELRDAAIFPEVWAALEIKTGRYADDFAADVGARKIYLKIRQIPIAR